jgi:hypothetical protein
MHLRPHHLLDIITQYGQGTPFGPSDYGHAVHTVAALVLSEPRQPVVMVVQADDICAPCRHLRDGQCVDLVRSLDPPMSKQSYNDDLDRRLLAHLRLQAGEALTMHAYGVRVRECLDDLETVCSHPGEDPAARLRHLRHGLELLGH